ncbi:MAG: hypothetical protein KKA81_11225 [Bacteroidetes bacterium]|nr:hypothetical protein [Bacteroidota bacterium]
MKTKITLLVCAILLSASHIFSQKLLDFGKFEVQIAEVKKIENFTSESGDLISANKRSNQLFEVKLEITSYDEGEFGLYPKMFNCMFQYRGQVLVTAAVAFGTKVIDRGTGTTTEYWYTDPEVSINIGVGKNDKFKRYLIVELPREVTKIFIQGPKVIGEISL